MSEWVQSVAAVGSYIEVCHWMLRLSQVNLVVSLDLRVLGDDFEIIALSWVLIHFLRG